MSHVRTPRSLVSKLGTSIVSRTGNSSVGSHSNTSASNKRPFLAAGISRTLSHHSFLTSNGLAQLCEYMKTDFFRINAVPAKKIELPSPSVSRTASRFPCSPRRFIKQLRWPVNGQCLSAETQSRGLLDEVISGILQKHV